MIKIIISITLLYQFAFGSTPDNRYIDALDTYSNYNEKVKYGRENAKSEYYVLSYTYSPTHCSSSRVTNHSKKSGGKNYLQCGSGREFSYILHGLWPQGSYTASKNYPRACEGDQKKIDRELLQNYFSMTPSVWLLQHEYEYHGTCMHDESLEEPKTYFDIAFKLHSQLTLPDKKLKNNSSNIKWLVKNNPHHSSNSIQYYNGGQEWQFCYDNNFEPVNCPSKKKSSYSKDDTNCKIKGNISKRSGKKYYFTDEHSNYSSVKISPSKGEKCFSSVNEAVESGWVKVP